MSLLRRRNWALFAVGRVAGVLFGCADGGQDVGLAPTEPPQETATLEAPPPVQAPPEAPSLWVSAVGDCTLGGDYRGERAKGSFHFELAAEGDDPAYPFSLVRSVLQADDLTIANLETTLTEATRPHGDPLSFRGKPAYAAMLREGSVEVVNVANNHAMDFGFPGHEDTVAAVRKEGVGVFGGDLVDVRTVRGIEVVNLGYTGGRDDVRPRVERDVRAHKRPDNLVIVSFHWGMEGSGTILPTQRLLGRAAVDAGADLVLGHHPHVLQGIEAYRGRNIVYSLGNFVFGGHSHPGDMDSVVYQQRFALADGGLVRGEKRIVPVRISGTTPQNDYRPVVLEGDEARRVLERLDTLSASVAEKNPRDVDKNSTTTAASPSKGPYSSAASGLDALNE